MKITQYGRLPKLVGTTTNSTALGGITIGSNTTGGVLPDYAWITVSSNAAIWRPNVHTITANSSNAATPPIVNFTGSGGIAVTVSSNTLTIGGGAAGVTDHGALTGLADDDHSSYVTVTAGGGETIEAHGTLGTTETIDLANGNVHTGTLNANCTFTFASVTNGVEAAFTLVLTEDGTGGWSPTWPGSVVWPGGTAPTHTTTAGSVTHYVFRTADGGSTWYGFKAGGGAEIAHSSNTYSGTVTIQSDATIAITSPSANTLNLSAPFYNQVVTDGEDVLVWHGADLVHELVRLY